MAALARRMLKPIARANAAYPWDHNAHYYGWIMRQLPERVETALDVGCGRGELVRLLAGRANAVHGIDADPEIVAHARELTNRPDSVTYSVGDALAGTPPGPYDVITCSAALHHMPFAEALAHFRQCLAPGGTLAIVGLYREETPSDYLLSAAAVPLNPAMGWVRNRGRRASRRDSMTARAIPPTMTFTDIAHQARGLLAGARLRRRLFFRYTLLWRKS